MKYRRFGRTDWQVSEVGYGMWGMAGWTASDDAQSAKSLDLAVENGVNFFDTAWGYGEGHSEELLGELVKRHPSKKLYTVSKFHQKTSNGLQNLNMLLRILILQNILWNTPIRL